MARSKALRKAAEPLKLNEPARSPLTAVESWVSSHLDWFVWLIVLTGFWLRFRLAGESYFNSDETQIMSPPLQRGLFNVYQHALVMPYGPINNFLLHIMTFFGTSEQYFRMVAVIPGALIPFVAYRWVAYVFDRAAGVATACILAFSPEMISISAEARHYMMHAFWLVCAFYFLERAFGEQSQKWMRWFGVSLLLALLTMYMSIWVTAAIGVYALLRIFNRELPRPLILEWVLIQAAAAIICVVAYATHLYKLRGSHSEVFAREVWLRDSYYRPQSENVAGFLGHSTKALFGYVFANPTAGAYMVFVFLLGIGLIFWTNARVPGNRGKVALSLVLPILATFAAALLGLYPYGGSRHDAYLALFVAVPVGVAISFLVRGSATVVLLAALFLVPVWQNVAQKNYLEVAPSLKRLDQMKAALDYLATRTPRPAVLVGDLQGSTTMSYYVCHGQIDDLRYLNQALSTYRCGVYQVLVFHEWSVDKSRLAQALWEGRAVSQKDFPDPAWIFSTSDAAPIPGNESNESGGKFGRLYIQRVSPP